MKNERREAPARPPAGGQRCPQAQWRSLVAGLGCCREDELNKCYEDARALAEQLQQYKQQAARLEAVSRRQYWNGVLTGAAAVIAAMALAAGFSR